MGRVPTTADEAGLQEEEILQFLEQNSGMIKAMEEKICRGTLEDDELNSIAAQAYIEAYNGYRQFARSKITSVFFHYLYKQLSKRAEIGFFIVSNSQASPPDEETMDSFEKFCGTVNSAPELMHGFVVHEKSFPQISGSLKKVLQILGSNKQKYNRLWALYDTDNAHDLADMVEYQIEQVKEMGMQLYVATCRNGTLRRVLVCAESETIARAQVNEYGDLLGITTYDARKELTPQAER